MTHSARLWLTRLAIAVLFVGLRPCAAALPADFNRDVRPILADTCFQCHGPDKAKRKADLRLDTEEGAAKVLTPGDPAKSELFRRITAHDDKERMPPAKSGRTLTSEQIDTLKRWIAEGAKWQKHWSFLPPVRSPLPTVKNAAWPRNGIDRFILARLDRDGLAPSPEAERTTLLRRVTLDLTGLPPTPQEVDAFLADTSPNAYEKVVDRLLASPRFGETLAARWLDAARYADTSGYQSDGERFMWRWRDWVIDALNANMPFDRFTVEQLAGDLLPNATLDQKIATGFNRNHRGNGEGGIIPEEYAVEYVVDRVETTATVWLGLTLGCARCHDHKFDPLSQKEFYRVFAYFNNVPEQGRALKYGNSPPYIKAPTPAQQREIAESEKRLAEAETQFAALRPQLDRAEAEWEKSLAAEPAVRWSFRSGETARFKLNGTGTDVTFANGKPAFADGRFGKAAAFDGRRYIEAGDVGDFGFLDKFSLLASVYPEGTAGGAIVSRMTETPRSEGYSVHLVDGKVQVHLTKRWLDDALRVETRRKLESGRWYQILVTYDGSRLAGGVRVFIDGKPEPTTVLLDELNQTFNTKEPFRIGSGGGPTTRFSGRIEDVGIYRECLTPEAAVLLAESDDVTALARIAADKRTPSQASKLRACFLDRYSPREIRAAHQKLVAARGQHERLMENLPTTMVMEEMPTPRATHVLIRGQYDKPGEKVTPGVPASLSAGMNPAAHLKDRLDLARWLVDRSNPLTARVTVNRYWQAYFGTGLVKTVGDFGAQGEWPTHSELLDWLATEFMDSGWDVKAMQRLIVTSATYRQSSKVTPPLLAADPENRLLARGPRFRLPAEALRDQALAASGLLVERIGGPSVKPYQPPGLWKELTGSEDYVPDHGDKLYRRSLYTFWKRTVAPPALVTFDAAGRETCVVRPSRTNTPLQALNLMNDVTFVEAARVLAQRAMKEGGTTPEGRITFAFRLATARKPQPLELQVLLDGYREHLADYRKDEKAARKLTSIGEAARDDKLDVVELAAFTTAAGVILNLDEVVTKE
jgi:Protein of unknown function (DUF1553)/Protein of unknown function (DUF1549)/Planctomycete cytochrome C/Concanavalin A-like lectin/glucanases superfamily